LIHDLRLDETTRLGYPEGTSQAPLWTRDGKMLVVGGPNGLASIETRAGATPQPLVRSHSIAVPWSFSPDGRRLAYYQMNESTAFDLWTVPVQQNGTHMTAGQPESFLQTPAFEVYPAFSPDGGWLAYSSNESGAWEV